MRVVVFPRLHGRSEHPGAGARLDVRRRVIDGHSGDVWGQSREGSVSSFGLGRTSDNSAHERGASAADTAVLASV